jgi:hypothetical protein
LRDIILQNLAAIDPHDAGYYPAKAAMGPHAAEWARMMRDIILQNWAAIDPHHAGYYSAKFGSN